MIEQKTVSYAKELGDVGDLLIVLIKDIKAKKDIATIITDTLQPLVTAVGGMDQVKTEIEADKIVAAATIGAKMGELTGVLLS